MSELKQDVDQARQALLNQVNADRSWLTAHRLTAIAFVAGLLGGFILAHIV